MAHTKVTKTGTQNTGTANTFSYSGSFDVFKASEVEVELDNVKLTFTTSTINDSATPREYTVDYSAKTIHIGGGNLAGTNSVVIQPVTDMGAPTPRATYSPGSSVTSADLNNNQLQLMRKAMEYDEQKLSSRGGTMTGNLHLGKDIDITFEGDTDNAYETTLTVADPDADRTITLPNVTGTVVTTGDTGTVTATMLAANSVDSSELVDGSVDLSHMSANSVDSDQYVNGSIDLVHMSANSVDSDQYVDGSIDTIHLSDGLINDAKLDSNSVTNAKIAADAVTGAKIADNAIDSEHITAGSVDLSHMSANSVDSDQYVDGSIDLIHMSANSVDSDQYVDGSIDLIHMSANSVDSDQYVDGSIDNIHIADTTISLGKIENVSSGQIIVGNGSNRPTAVAMSGDVAISAGGTTNIQVNTIEMSMLDCEQTSITNSDAHIPTSGAVVDYVTDALTSAGSFEVIADEDNFPATHPDPKASASVAGIAGMVVSIQNAGGLQINSSGVATNARKAGSGSDDITINGFPSSMRAGVNGNPTPYELSDETGLLVTTTAQTDTAYASGAVYEFHRVFVKPADYVQLSDDINDFNSRYRFGTRTANNDSSNDDGDLFFDTGANTMYVYDGAYNSGGSWKEVTSAGDFKFLTVKDHDQASGGSGPTFNGSNEEFDLFDGSADASINSAAQLIVVLNGVVQKPNSGTFSGSEEGFYLNDTHGIKFCDPPPSGSTLFVTQIGSAVTLNEPADDSVSAAKIQTGAVSTAKIADDSVTGAKISNHLDLPDNNTIRFGASNDLQIYHESATPQNIINSYTSNPLTIMSNGNTSIKSNNGDNMGVFKKDGAVELYYDNSKKLETTTDGVQVTGEVVSGTLHCSGKLDLPDSSGATVGRVLFGDSDDLQIYHDGSHSYLNNSTGRLRLQGDDVRIENAAGSEFLARFTADGAAELYYDDTKMFETAAGGVTVTDDDTSVQVKLISSSGTTGYLYGSGTTNIGLLDAGGDWAIKHENDDSTKFYVQTNLKATIDADGLKFGSDTATANALNDYEEGTWTPVVSNGVTSLSYTTQVGTYVKVGKFIHCTWYIQFVATGVSSTHFYMGGLPVNTANTGTYSSGAHINYLDANFTNSAHQKVYIGNNSTIMYFYNNNGGPGAPNASYLTTQSDTHHIYGTITYRTT